MAVSIDNRERIAETWAEAVFLAHLDHNLLVGHEIVVPWLFNRQGGLDSEGPFTVRLLPAEAQDIEREMETHLDPYWDVEPVCDESRRIFAEAKALDHWIQAGGPSYLIIESDRVSDAAITKAFTEAR